MCIVCFFLIDLLTFSALHASQNYQLCGVFSEQTTMESLIAPMKRKRERINTHLTTSKKCKHYRDKKSQQNLQSLEDFSSATESEWETEREETFGYLHPQHSSTCKPVQLKAKCQSKNTQTYLKTKNIAVQNVPSMRSRGNRTTAVCLKQVQHSTQTSDIIFETSDTEKLLDKLQVNFAFDKFVSILKEHEQIDKFVKTVNAIASGDLHVTNLCWKAALDMGTLFSCKSTTQMEYDKEWLEFCQVIYHMFGGGVINMLRGRGHFSQVMANRAQKGKFPPSSGEYNFPIPSVPTLKKLNIGFPSKIPVGFVEQSLQLAQERAKTGCEYVLSFDSKLISPGCKGESNGDSNMWGFEGPPNLSQSVKILKRCLKVAESIRANMENTSSGEHYSHFTELLNISSLWIKRLQNRITGSFYLRKKLVEKCGDNDELKYKHRHKMSSLNQNTSECESVVRRLLEVNIEITEIMVALNNNLDVHIRDKAWHINLIEHSNNFQLLPPEIFKMVLDIDKEENYQYIKQRTTEWFKIRKNAHVTGSTLNKAFGLDTLLKQKEHHYVFVRGHQEPPVSRELQKMFDHGTRNEIDAITTLVSTIVPAYLPACFAF